MRFNVLTWGILPPWKIFDYEFNVFDNYWTLA